MNKLTLLLILSIWISGCTKGIPEITSLSGPPSILITDPESAELSIAPSTPWQSKDMNAFQLTMSGKINPLLTIVEISFDSGATWADVNQLAGSSWQIQKDGCKAECPFTWTFATVNAPSLTGLRAEEMESVLLRGRGDFGQSPISVFKVKRLTRGLTAVGSISGGGPVGPKQDTTSHLHVTGAKIVGQAAANTTSGLHVKGHAQ